MISEIRKSASECLSYIKANPARTAMVVAAVALVVIGFVAALLAGGAIPMLGNFDPSTQQTIFTVLAIQGAGVLVVGMLLFMHHAWKGQKTQTEPPLQMEANQTSQAEEGNSLAEHAAGHGVAQDDAAHWERVAQLNSRLAKLGFIR